jgi:acetyl-CoA carboxylase carboxyl transferase subunit beta
VTERIEVLTDSGSFTEIDADLAPHDPLSFSDKKPYAERLTATAKRTGRLDGAVFGTATIGGRPVVLCVLDFAFMGGSMGSVVGEKVTRAGELALSQRVPLITCSSSGGARMQEGIFSLMQMAKTSAMLRRLADARVPHISLLADPVYGGVMASYASLGDIIIAEPGARAGFAGPQVIEQTIRQKLPAGFQSAEFLLAQGHIDAVVPRSELFAMLERIVAFHSVAEDGVAVPPGSLGVTYRPDKDDSRDAWQGVRLARDPGRPLADEYLAGAFDAFVELRGDRWSEDDPAVCGGLAMLDGAPVMVIAHRKGRGTKDAIARNFGMPHPSGYRKARRLMEYAERFNVPLVTLVDTAGAYPGLKAEQDNQSGAIASNLALLAGLRVPVVTVVVGEGGSGGALALAVSDRLLMLENATLSVISPEGCATILFGDASRAEEAARSLRLTAADLVELGIADEIVPEPVGGAHKDVDATVRAVRSALLQHLGDLVSESLGTVLKERQRRLREIGRLADPRSGR